MPQTSAAQTPEVNSAVNVYHSSNVPEFNAQTESWLLWKEKLDIHFCGINCTDDNAKKAILLKSVGAAPYEVLHSLCSPQSPVSHTYKALCDMLEKQYIPPTIVFRERKLFYAATKSESESVSEWFARTKNLHSSANLNSTQRHIYLIDL